MLDIDGELTSRRLRWALQRQASRSGRLEIDLLRTRVFPPEGLAALLALIDGARSAGREVLVHSPTRPEDVAQALAVSGLPVALDELGARHRLALRAPAPTATCFGIRRFDGVAVLDEIAVSAMEWASRFSLEAGALVYTGVCEAGQNVLDHSGSDHGFVALDMDPREGVRFAISDAGRGFRRSLARLDPDSDAAALQLAFRAEATSAGRPGHGRGLAWLADKTADDHGELVIMSGSAAAIVSDDRGSSNQPDVRTVPRMLPGALVRGCAPVKTEAAGRASGVA